MLGRIGPSREAARFLDEMLRGEDLEDRGLAVGALRHWGDAGVPALLKVAQDHKQLPGLRQWCAQHFIRFGTTEQVAQCLRDMLRPGVDPFVTRAAIEAIRKRKLSDTVPELKRIALSEEMNQNAREKAIDALIDLGKRDDTAKVLLELIKPKTNNAVRLHVIYYLAHMRLRAGVPKLLEVLEDENDRLRRDADVALRAILDLPEGVGYDWRTGNAEAWRNWWRRKSESDMGPGGQ